MSNETAPAADTAASSAPVSDTAAPAATDTPDIYSGSTQADPVQAPENASMGQESVISRLYTSEGGLSENYTKLLEEAGMGNLANTVAKYKSADGLLKGAANLVEFAGKKVEGVVVPNEGSTEAEVAEFRRAIGVPETADAYELKPENMPEGLEFDGELASEWSNVFHEVGISQEQAQKIAQAYSDITAKQLETATGKLNENAEAIMQEQAAEVKKAWGRNYDQNMRAAVDMAEVLGFNMDSDADMVAIRNPKVLNMLLDRSRGLQEGSLPRGGQPNANPSETPKGKADAIFSKYNGRMGQAPPEIQKLYTELRKLDAQQSM